MVRFGSTRHRKQRAVNNYFVDLKQLCCDWVQSDRSFSDRRAVGKNGGLGMAG